MVDYPAYIMGNVTLEESPKLGDYILQIGSRYLRARVTDTAVFTL